jgi:hypothetical protein
MHDDRDPKNPANPSQPPKETSGSGPASQAGDVGPGAVPAELAQALEGFDLPEGEEDPFGDLDPQEAMRNPMGALNKMFENPKAMEAFQSFMSTPMARQIMEQGFNSPMLQQMMGGNPMLQQMMGQMGGAQMPPGFAMPPGFPGGAQEVDEDDQDEDDEDEDDGIDEPVLDLLNPPHGGPAYPAQGPMTWATLLAQMPDTMRQPLTELAASKLLHHLGPEGVQRLVAAARTAGRENVLDLLVNQGAFAGELAWYAICRLEDEDNDEDAAAAQTTAFAVLAKHALSCVALPCGWCVPSFVTQLLGYLIETEQLSDADVRYATWAIASQPTDGREGIFEFSLDDIKELADGLSNAKLDPQTRAVSLAALVAWRILGEEQPQALPAVLEAIPPPQAKQLLLVLGTLIDGQREVQGLRARGWPLGLVLQAIDLHAQVLGVGETLDLGRYWAFDGQALAAHQGLLRALDAYWADAPAAARERYLDHVLSCDVDPLRAQAYQVAAAWLPKPYLTRAAQDPAESIRRWAQEAQR